MITYEIDFAKNRVVVFKDCPICIEFYEKHPTLKDDMKLRVRQKKNGEWYHQSNKGRMIHKHVLKNQAKGVPL